MFLLMGKNCQVETLCSTRSVLAEHGFRLFAGADWPFHAPRLFDGQMFCITWWPKAVETSLLTLLDTWDTSTSGWKLEQIWISNFTTYCTYFKCVLLTCENHRTLGNFRVLVTQYVYYHDIGGGGIFAMSFLLVALARYVKCFWYMNYFEFSMCSLVNVYCTMLDGMPIVLDRGLYAIIHLHSIWNLDKS